MFVYYIQKPKKLELVNTCARMHAFEEWVEEQRQKAKEGYEIHLQKVATLKV